ncbi:unnamed protein product, partial [Urochloa humidicola]
VQRAALAGSTPDDPLDVLVVGGGATGLGAALDDAKGSLLNTDRIPRQLPHPRSPPLPHEDLLVFVDALVFLDLCARARVQCLPGLQKFPKVV